MWVEFVIGLVLSLAPRGFSPGTPVFPSPQSKTNSSKFQFDQETGARTCLHELLLRTPYSLVSKQIFFTGLTVSHSHIESHLGL